VTPEAIRQLQNYDWPGNIRELKNLIERLVIMTPSAVIDAKDIRLIKSKQEQSDYFSYKTLKEAREAFERDLIAHKLGENNWNISRTAEVLDIERSNLHRKIRAYKIKLDN
jgi:two-component system nitrogen regulation response regulator NtrX